MYSWNALSIFDFGVSTDVITFSQWQYILVMAAVDTDNSTLRHTVVISVFGHSTFCANDVQFMAVCRSKVFLC